LPREANSELINLLKHDTFFRNLSINGPGPSPPHRESFPITDTIRAAVGPSSHAALQSKVRLKLAHKGRGGVDHARGGV
jgi:hypothetical protein